eukprot:m.79033 g.79033  ORF g.79033 m.79033 type:complete len:1540 (+) comp9265_c0_seq4:864-5483(+)
MGSDAPEWSFCGNRTFLDVESSNDPIEWFDVWQYSTCFTDTVVVAVPALVLTIAFVYRLTLITSIPVHDNLQSSRLYIGKQTVMSILIVFALSQLVDAILFGRYNYQIIPPAVALYGTSLALTLMILEHNRGARMSRILGFYWLAELIIRAVSFYAIVQRLDDMNVLQHGSKLVLRAPVSIGSFAGVLAMTVLSSIREPPYVYEGDKPCPELSSSLLSLITFSWLNDLMALGFSRPLVDDDLWGLNSSDQAPFLASRFAKSWAKQRIRKHPSILRALSDAFGTLLYSAGLFKLVQDLLAFVQPQLLRQLIIFIENRNDPDESRKEPQQKGLELAGSMFIVALVQSIFLHQYFHRVYKSGMQLRSAVISAVYQKSLRLSQAARTKEGSSSGEVVNLMAIDAQRFMDVVTYIHMLWSAPLQISLALVFLIDLLEPRSVLAGLAVMIVMIPINIVIAKNERSCSRKLMAKKDSRIKEMGEILNGMKVLKLYAWERAFKSKVQGLRSEELTLLRKAALWRACSLFSWTCAPFLVSLVTFVVYTKVEDKELTPQTAFVALSLFNLLRFPLAMLPMLITSMVQAQVSVRRLTKFLMESEVNPTNVERVAVPAMSRANKGDVMASIHHGMFAWSFEGYNTVPVLKNIDFEARAGQVTAVVGPVGSGKTSLMLSLLGEMEKMAGNVRVRGTVAYVPQQAWIQNATLRDNILFGQAFDPVKYENVISACALASDLAQLPAGDLTEIGEKGINLSGGQKQRVSLARAAYQGAHVFIFDDPLSAVDAHVGKHIFSKLIGPQGMLKDACRVLVTHAIQYLPECDHVVCIRDNTIQEQGSYGSLMASNGPFSKFIDEYLAHQNDDEDSPESPTSPTSAVSTKSFNLSSPMQTVDISSTSPTTTTTSRPTSKESKGSNTNGEEPTEKSPLIGQQLVKKETAETGEVRRTIYVKYFVAVGVFMMMGLVGLYASAYTFNVLTNFWLKMWSQNTCPSWVDSTVGCSLDTFIGVYGGLGLVNAMMVFLAAVNLAFGAIRASNKLHTKILARVLRAPMSWFDTTPMGRIVNRFSQDVYTIDEMIPRTLGSFTSCAMQVLSTIVVVSLASPIFLAAVVPLGITFYLIQRYYVRTSRQLKRLESVSRSPIYSHFSETLSGVSSIKAYDKAGLFVADNQCKVDFNLQAYYPSVSANRWLAMRLEFLGNCVIFFAALFSVLEIGKNVDASTAGLSLTYAMSVTQTLNWMVRMATELETNIVAVERVDEYTNIETEKPSTMARLTPLTWPDGGQIEFRSYACRYRDGLPLVLRGINCTIGRGEKVGVVGRTGAGKSSLMLALFRIVEPAEGTIVIDGEDITQIGLDDLRKKITIMPQDAVLFAGTVRQNIDPFGEYDDQTLWNALNTAHLGNHIRSLATATQPDGLQAYVAEGGKNFSDGERQLLCLARAVLRKSKVLVLDEATAACDMETDDRIQVTIRQVFSDCTVLTIAHRLNTIMDSDRVMVLDKGSIAEFDTPDNLLAKPDSIFYGMAQSAGIIDNKGVRRRPNAEASGAAAQEETDV